jgi:hypothetical protein
MRQTLLILTFISVFGCKQPDNETSSNADSTIVKVDKQEIKVTTLNCGLDNEDKVYEYLPRVDVPRHLFTIIFKCNGDSLTGKIFGPLPEGEHGLAFFKADLKNIKIDRLENIEFEFTHGDLFDRQITINNYLESSDSSKFGFSRALLIYKGRNYGDSLILNCISEYYDCYTDVMKFMSKN